jgi:hypothetical protein
LITKVSEFLNVSSVNNQSNQESQINPKIIENSQLSDPERIVKAKELL